MDRVVYVAMSGAQQTMLAQAVNANNLANATTVGFKADLEAFRSMPVFGDGYASRVYAVDETNGTQFAAGSLMTTGRALDVAVNGDGWMAVQAPDGNEAYTRAGDLHVTAGGMLVNGAGYPVLGNGGPIVIPPAEKIEIGDDGTVSVVPLGQEATTLAALDRVRLVRPAPGELVKGEDGLMRVVDGGVAAADASVRLISGALESSNVNSVEAMVNMIALARQFEMQVKMMKTAEEIDAASAQLMQVG